MKKAIFYKSEECVIIKTISISNMNFSFFVAVERKKVIYLKQNIYNDKVTYAALDKMMNVLPEYNCPAIYNMRVMLDTFVNTINLRIFTGAITESDEILEMILQFEKIVKDVYITKMTDLSCKIRFNKTAMYEVTNTIKKIDGKVNKMSLASLLNINSDDTSDVFLSQNWLEKENIDNKKLVYESILKSNKAHRRSPIDFIFNNKVLNVYMVVMIVAVVTFASCLEMITKWKSTGDDTEKIVTEIKEEVFIENKDEEEEIKNDPNAIDPTDLPENQNKESNSESGNVSRWGKQYNEFENVSAKNIDWKTLQKRNSDTIGWIFINNTNVNYPFVQGLDNDFYSNHDFNKKYNVAGWLWADWRCNFDKLGRNNIIYGHGRTDQVMFGSLEKTLDKSWYTDKNNQYIKIVTPKKDMLWQIVSIYVVPVENEYLFTAYLNDDDTYSKWIDKMISRSIYDFGVKPTIKDKFLTLSTCKDYKGNRIVVQAILVSSKDV